MGVVRVWGVGWMEVIEGVGQQRQCEVELSRPMMDCFGDKS